MGTTGNANHEDMLAGWHQSATPSTLDFLGKVGSNLAWACMLLAELIVHEPLDGECGIKKDT